jgi:hypothetical protein
MTCFDINSLNLGRSRQVFGSTRRSPDLSAQLATYLIIAGLREWGTNLPRRSLSQIFARKGQAILSRAREGNPYLLATSALGKWRRLSTPSPPRNSKEI